MKNKSNIKYTISTIILIMIVMASKCIYAENFDGVKNNEYTQQYKIWYSLSDEEKSKYMQPLAYPIKFDPTYLDNNSSAAMSRVGTTLPSKYNLNDEINITVKNQGTTNECWAFSMISVLESNIAKGQEKYQRDFQKDIWIMQHLKHFQMVQIK